MPAKILGKQKIAVTQQHIGFDIEKSKGDGSMAEGFKGQGHDYIP